MGDDPTASQLDRLLDGRAAGREVACWLAHLAKCTGLPAGGSYSDLIYYFAGSPYAFLDTGPAPMPAGSSNGTGPFTVTANPQDFAEAYANTVIPSGLQVNSSFNITLWVSDGTTKQTESVPVVIKASCKRKY
jgi:hypothetical protein